MDPISQPDLRARALSIPAVIVALELWGETGPGGPITAARRLGAGLGRYPPPSSRLAELEQLQVQCAGAVTPSTFVTSAEPWWLQARPGQSGLHVLVNQVATATFGANNRTSHTTTSGASQVPHHRLGTILYGHHTGSSSLRLIRMDLHQASSQRRPSSSVRSRIPVCYIQ